MLNYRFGSVSGRSTPCPQTAGLSGSTLLSRASSLTEAQHL